MPSLLILADHYPPLFAPRALSIVQHLTRCGWQCHVITEEIPATQLTASGHGNVFADEADCCSVERVRPRKRFSRQEAIAEALWSAKERRLEQYIKTHHSLQQTDLILAFSYRNFPFRTASRLSRFYGIPWVADCRDIIEQYDNWRFAPNLPEHLSTIKQWALQQAGRYLIRKRNKWLKSAARVVTVSPWHKQQLEPILGAERTLCLYNGFDSALFIPKPIATEQFHIVYTGRIMSLGMRDPSLLFEALSAPELQEPVKNGQIIVDWYTDEHSKALLATMLRNYPECVRNAQKMHQTVPFRQVPEILNRASVILLLGNKEQPQGPHGIVSTKLFEALAMEKPILYVRSDEAVAASLLQRAGTGLAAVNSAEVIHFLRTKFACWQKNSYNCTAKAEETFVRSFRRDAVAEQYRLLLVGVMEQKDTKQRNG